MLAAAREVNCAKFMILISYRVFLLAEEKFERLLGVEAAWPSSYLWRRTCTRSFSILSISLFTTLFVRHAGVSTTSPIRVKLVPTNYQALRLLSVPLDTIPFDFSCGADVLDEQHILLEKPGITMDKRISSYVNFELQNDRRPMQSISFQFSMGRSFAEGTARFDMARRTTYCSFSNSWKNSS